MQKTIEKIVNYAAARAEPDEIILFGSMANGTNNNYSDIDLLIVTDNHFHKKQIIAEIEHFVNEMSLKADVLVYSKNELQKALTQPNSFLAGVLQSGKIVYRKDVKTL